MKKTTTIFFVLFFLSICFPFHVYAETVIYSIPELDMTIDVPTSFYVVTPDIVSHPDKLQAAGIDVGNVRDIMEEKSIYLVAYHPSMNYIFSIYTFSDNSFKSVGSLESLTTEELQKEISSMINVPMETPDGTSYSISDATLYTDATVPFIKMAVNTPADSPEYRYYFTVRNGTGIYIEMYSEVGARAYKQYVTHKAMVDSIRFTSPSAPPVQEFVFERILDKGVIGAISGLVLATGACIIALFRKSKAKIAASTPLFNSPASAPFPSQQNDTAPNGPACALEEKIAGMEPAPQISPHPAPSAAASISVPAQPIDALASQLRTYKSLLDEGVLTQDEFNAKKAELLNNQL